MSALVKLSPFDPNRTLICQLSFNQPSVEKRCRAYIIRNEHRFYHISLLSGHNLKRFCLQLNTWCTSDGQCVWDSVFSPSVQRSYLLALFFSNIWSMSIINQESFRWKSRQSLLYPWLMITSLSWWVLFYLWAPLPSQAALRVRCRGTHLWVMSPDCIVSNAIIDTDMCLLTIMKAPVEQEVRMGLLTSIYYANMTIGPLKFLWESIW